MEDKIKKIASIGYAAKGTVYAITGVLAFLAAFNMGGKKAGKFQVLDFLEKQAFGKVLLAIIGLGLICYALWRFIQSIQDPEGIGTDGKAIIKRSSFFISGLAYLGLGIFAIVDIFYEPSSSGGSSEKTSLLSGTAGSYIFIVIGIALAAKGIYQFIKVYKGDFLKKLHIKSVTKLARQRFIKNIGYAGLISRGIVEGLIAYFFLKAGFASSNSEKNLKGTSEAFSFLEENEWGSWLLGIVAAGLVCYGIYMFTTAKYRQFNT